ncbi:MAG: type II toxin-antitoxin system HicA family toxin [Limisphaerales bacterium]
MKTPRDLSGAELAKELRKLGYVITRQSGSHLRVTTQAGGQQTVAWDGA